MSVKITEIEEAKRYVRRAMFRRYMISHLTYFEPCTRRKALETAKKGGIVFDASWQRVRVD